jgi:hypothetical protein
MGQEGQLWWNWVNARIKVVITIVLKLDLEIDLR